MDEQLLTKIRDLEKAIEGMRANQTIFVIPKLTSDPASPIEGQIWENTTTHHLKIYLNGATTQIV
jgi:hypothetical protein